MQSVVKPIQPTHAANLIVHSQVKVGAVAKINKSLAMQVVGNNGSNLLLVQA